MTCSGLKKAGGDWSQRGFAFRRTEQWNCWCSRRSPPRGIGCADHCRCAGVGGRHRNVAGLDDVPAARAQKSVRVAAAQAACEGGTVAQSLKPFAARYLSALQSAVAAAIAAVHRGQGNRRASSRDDRPRWLRWGLGGNASLSMGGGAPNT